MVTEIEQFGFAPNFQIKKEENKTSAKLRVIMIIYFTFNSVFYICRKLLTGKILHINIMTVHIYIRNHKRLGNTVTGKE